MVDHETDSDCALSVIMAESGGWVGLPPIEWPRGAIVDGRRRIALARRFGYQIPKPRHPESRLAAARLLALLGHPERAAALADGSPLRLPSDARAAVDAVEKATVKRNARLAVLAKTHNRSRARVRVVDRLRALRDRMLERGTPASIAEIEAVLGDWS